MNERPNQLVVDVGGGKSCPFAKYRRPGFGTRIVAVDVSADEIEENRDVDETRTADIMQELPFEAGEVDMIVSRSVLEHLVDLEAFVANSARVLKPGGYFIHLFPGRFAPFAIINRMFPQRLSRRILFFLHPQTVGICGFPAFYDRCSYSALARLVESRGFEIEEQRMSYYQSRYFDFFFPLYLLSVGYELLARASGLSDLSAYVLIVARKPLSS
jgi:SAM-dependent methyltransferase